MKHLLASYLLADPSLVASPAPDGAYNPIEQLWVSDGTVSAQTYCSYWCDGSAHLQHNADLCLEGCEECQVAHPTEPDGYCEQCVKRCDRQFTDVLFTECCATCQLGN